MSKVAEWGVQSIDGAKAASAFAVGALSGIETIGADNAAAVEYFNLQGVKVATPGSGLYIRRQGSTVEKVYVR